MAERKLAYIATISQIDSIPGKDRIVYASLKNLGWQVIVDNTYKVGDKVVYVEIDSILPVKPEYEFLRKRCFSEKWNGFVIKGMKMAGLVSYGLVLPLPERIILPKEICLLDAGQLFDGFDMTEYLSIRKKEDEVPETKNEPKSRIEKLINWICRKLHIKRKPRKKIGVSDGWLSFAQKTDETRIENLSYLFDAEFKETPVYTTVKLDGQSATFAVWKGFFFMASRNVILYRQKLKKAIKELNPQTQRPGMDNFMKIAARYDIPKKLSGFVNNGKNGIVLQGELCGPSIQKNPMDMTHIDLFVFNIYWPNDSKSYFSWLALNAKCQKLGLKTVPFIERRKFDWADKAALKEYAKGKYDNGKDREGVVIRYDSDLAPIPEALKGMSNIWSFKVINDDYILGK